MRITKVYTKTGDKGKTRLAGGQQVWKDSLRVEAYGTIDELNAALGVVRAQWLNEAKGTEKVLIERELHWMQNKLFDVGGLLATAPGQRAGNDARRSSRQRPARRADSYARLSSAGVTRRLISTNSVRDTRPSGRYWSIRLT